MIAEAPSSSLPVRGADAIPYDELSDTEPEEEAAEGFAEKAAPVARMLERDPTVL